MRGRKRGGRVRRGGSEGGEERRVRGGDDWNGISFNRMFCARYLAAWSKDGFSLLHLSQGLLCLIEGDIHERWMDNHSLDVLCEVTQTTLCMTSHAPKPPSQSQLQLPNSTSQTTVPLPNHRPIPILCSLCLGWSRPPSSFFLSRPA